MPLYFRFTFYIEVNLEVIRFLGSISPFTSIFDIYVLDLLNVNIEVVRNPCGITAVVFWVGGRMLFCWENHNLLVYFVRVILRHYQLLMMSS